MVPGTVSGSALDLAFSLPASTTTLWHTNSACRNAPPAAPNAVAGMQQELCSTTQQPRRAGPPLVQAPARSRPCRACMDLLASQQPPLIEPSQERGQWWPWSPRPVTRFSTKYSPPSTSCFGGWPSSIVPHLHAKRSQGERCAALLKEPRECSPTHMKHSASAELPFCALISCCRLCTGAATSSTGGPTRHGTVASCERARLWSHRMGQARPRCALRRRM